MREHWLFRYPDGCSFAIMDRSAFPSELVAWFEEFGSATRVRAARDAGIVVELVSGDEFDAKHRATFGRFCEGEHPKLPKDSDSIDDDIEQHAIDHAVEAEVERLHEEIAASVANPDSPLRKGIGAVIDRLRPGLAPYDRREAIDEITGEILRVMADV